MSDTRPLLTKEEVGDILRIQPSTVLRLARLGELRSVRFGNRVRFNPDDVQAYIESAS